MRSARTRILLIILAVVCLTVLFTTRVSRKMPDFEVYWTAGSRALAAQPLYRIEDGHYQFKYLPAFAVLAAPLALLPMAAAKALWFALSAVLMLVLLVLSVVATPEARRPPALLLVLTFVAMAKFYAHELLLGQVNLLFAVMVVAAVVLLRRGQEAVAGVLFALAVIVKPYALLFAPWLATRKSRLPFAVMIAVVVMALLLPAARYGWHGNLKLLSDWRRTVTESSVPNLLNQDNVSLAAMWAKWLGEGSTASIAAAVTSIILLGLAAIVIAGRGQLPVPDPLEASLLLVLIPLLSPQGWDYVFLISTPGVVLLFNYYSDLPLGLRSATGVAIIVVAFTIYDLVGRNGYAMFMALSGITICYVIEYVALVALRFRRAA
jgi:hypothetical protein